MVKQQYHIFHLKYQIKMFKQLHNTLLWYTNVSWRTVQDDSLSEAIQKYLFYLQFLQLGLY